MRNVQIPTNLINDLQVPQIIDITDELTKLKPNGWDGIVPPRKLEEISSIVWHHSGMFLSDGCTAESHAKSHVNKQEGGCPYHFHLLDGQIRQTQDILTFTYGVASNNTYTVHVCVEGCYVPKDGKQADVLTEDNLRAMIALELTLRALLPNYKASNGHNYYKPTACPGYSMTKFKEAIASTQLRLAIASERPERVKQAVIVTNRLIDLTKKAQDTTFEFSDVALDKTDKVVAFMKKEGLLYP